MSEGIIVWSALAGTAHRTARRLRGRSGALVTPDFTLHMKGRDDDAGATGQFHVEHFRGRLGDHVYELIDEPSR